MSFRTLSNPNPKIQNLADFETWLTAVEAEAKASHIAEAEEIAKLEADSKDKAAKLSPADERMTAIFRQVGIGIKLFANFDKAWRNCVTPSFLLDRIVAEAELEKEPIPIHLRPFIKIEPIPGQPTKEASFFHSEPGERYLAQFHDPKGQGFAFRIIMKDRMIIVYPPRKPEVQLCLLMYDFEDQTGCTRKLRFDNSCKVMFSNYVKMTSYAGDIEKVCRATRNVMEVIQRCIKVEKGLKSQRLSEEPETLEDAERALAEAEQKARAGAKPPADAGAAAAATATPTAAAAAAPANASAAAAAVAAKPSAKQ